MTEKDTKCSDCMAVSALTICDSVLTGIMHGMSMEIVSIGEREEGEWLPSYPDGEGGSELGTLNVNFGILQGLKVRIDDMRGHVFLGDECPYTREDMVELLKIVQKEMRRISFEDGKKDLSGDALKSHISFLDRVIESCEGNQIVKCKRCSNLPTHMKYHLISTNAASSAGLGTAQPFLFICQILGFCFLLFMAWSLIRYFFNV